MEELEFHSLLRKLSLDSNVPSKKEEIKEEERLVIKDISEFNEKDFAFYLETRGSIYSKSEVLGVGIYDGENGYFISREEIDKYKYLFEMD